LILAGALPQTPLGSSRRSPRPLAGFKGVLLLKEEGREKERTGEGGKDKRGSGREGMRREMRPPN